MALAGGAVNGDSGIVELKPYAALGIDLGSTTDTAAGKLELSDAELNTVTAGTLRIGHETAGPMQITGKMGLTRVPTLHLISGSGIYGAGQTIGVANLALSGGAGEIDVTTAVEKIAAENTAGGITIGNMRSGGLTVDDVDGIAGVKSGQADIVLMEMAGSLTFAETMNAGTGTATLGAAGAMINGSASDVNVIGGGISLMAGDGIGHGKAFMTRTGKLHAENKGANTNIEVTNVGVLEVERMTNSGSGSIVLNNTGAITTGIDTIQAVYGSVTIVAHSPLTVGTGGVRAKGTITLEAAGNDPADQLTINGEVSSVEGDVFIKGETVTKNAPVNAPKGVVMRAEHGGLPLPESSLGSEQAVQDTSEKAIQEMVATLDKLVIETAEEKVEKEPPPSKEETEDEKKKKDSTKKDAPEGQADGSAKAKLPYCN